MVIFPPRRDETFSETGKNTPTLRYARYFEEMAKGIGDITNVVQGGTGTSFDPNVIAAQLHSQIHASMAQFDSVEAMIADLIVKNQQLLSMLEEANQRIDSLENLTAEIN